MSLLRSLASVVAQAIVPPRPQSDVRWDGCPVCRRIEEERQARLA